MLSIMLVAYGIEFFIYRLDTDGLCATEITSIHKANSSSAQIVQEFNQFIIFFPNFSHLNIITERGQFILIPRSSPPERLGRCSLERKREQYLIIAESSAVCQDFLSKYLYSKPIPKANNKDHTKNVISSIFLLYAIWAVLSKTGGIKNIPYPLYNK